MRLALGLKPLDLEVPQNENKEAEAVKNYKDLKDKQKALALKEKLAKNIETAKYKLNLNKKIKGKSLGEIEDEKELDSMSWVNKTRSLHHSSTSPAQHSKKADKLKKDIKKEFKVLHEMTDFKNEKSVILTLKDSNILESDDELENIQLKEKEKLEENIKKKKKTKVYDLYQDDEFEITNIGRKKEILSQYNDVTGETKKKKGFLFSGDQIKIENDLDKEINKKDGTVRVSLDSVNKIKPMEDYYTSEEAKIKFKTSKKKNRKIRNSKNNETENDLPVNKTSSFIDDDNELQSAMLASRVLAMRETSKAEPDSKFIKIAKNNSNNTPLSNEDAKYVVFDELTDFVQNIGYNAHLVDTKKDKTIEKIQGIAKKETLGEDIYIDNNQKEPSAKSTENFTVLEKEPLVGSGISATLALLRQKGIYKDATKEQIENDRLQRERKIWLLEQKKKELLDKAETEKRPETKAKSYRRDSDKHQKQAQDLDQKMKDYKPSFELVHVDDKGNKLTPKEAFKHLSHRFHGKAPGKQKTEKIIKRMEERKKEEELAVPESIFSGAKTHDESSNVKKHKKIKRSKK